VIDMSDKLNGPGHLPWLIGAALTFVVLACVAFVMTGSLGRPAAGAGTAELLTLSQAIPLQAQRAVGGEEAAFDNLAAARQRFVNTAKATGLATQQPSANADMLGESQAVLDARQPVMEAYQASTEVKKLMPQLLEGLGDVASGLGAVRVQAISRHVEKFEMTGRQLEQDLAAVASGLDISPTTSQRLSDGAEYLGQVLAGLSGEDATLGLPRVNADAEARLRAVAGLRNRIADLVRDTVANFERLYGAHEAATGLATTGDALYTSLQKMNDAARASGGKLPQWLPLALLALAAACLIGLAFAYRATANIRKAARKQEDLNVRNQEAILRLLDELSNLADGDLTVQATVTEDITGAIADSINYAIEALRELVGTINSTALTLETATKQTQASAGQLAKASVAQSKQVGAASESVAAMASSVEEVSGNAERSSDVARHSVDVAHKGAEAVRRTIDGMNAIRETIQDTSKRIKRLGESSQEIGNIVELINDIAEQTNILALNASIQASMAGEAGRGFAVVADEVQRLAERAANATKQIEVHVRTIQADTNEAVVSMERSTTDVVGGALLAENAGAALEEIEQVSNQIASLVQNISASARQQATGAQNIARNMQVLREISSQTAESTAATSNSIGKLADLSGQLRKSITGFRLPGVTTQASVGSDSTSSSGVRKVSGLGA
jgi:twitching motility protein PilJ